MEGHLVQRGKSKTWYLVYDEPSRKGKRVQRWVSLKTKSKAEASKKKREMLGAAESAKAEERPTDMTVSELFASWLECRESTLAANTHIRYGTLTRSYAEPVIGPMLVADVRPVHIDRIYAAMRRQDLSERTCLHVHRAVHAAFSFAVRYLQLVPDNVVSRVQAPRVRPRENEAFGLEQIRLVLEAAQGTRLEVPVVTSVLTGVRRGELLAMKWSNVDFEQRSIFVTESLEQTRRFGLRFKEPKSRSSRRRVPMSDQLAEILQAHREQQKESLRGFGGVDDDLVFSNPDGTAWPPDTLTKQFAAMCSLVGIKGFRLHDLRHAFASITISNGTSVKEVSTLLGHSSPMLTLSTYARSMEGQGREAVSLLAQSLLRKHQESPSSC